jgi:serine/threonine protein kinase
LVRDGLLGEGASGHIYRVHRRTVGESLALKVFKGAVTSDGLPEHELAASLAAGPHPTLTTPCAELCDHPDGARGILLPLIPDGFENLAAPPSLESCTRDAYDSDLRMPAAVALQVARQMAQALAHLHQRGVMHGDFYAHNILWRPETGEALLGDFGAGTLLPSDDPVQARAWLALEVRAFGYLLEELLACVPDTELHTLAAQRMRSLMQACLALQPASRPTMAAVLRDLQ